MTTKRVRYPGRLGKAQLQSDEMLPFYRACESTDRGSFEEWHNEFVASRMAEICLFYSIPASDPDRWFRLAIALAFDHVPAFQITVGKPLGRPTKKGRILAKGMFHVPAKPGRNRVDDRWLLKYVRDTAKKSGMSGRGSIGKALTILIQGIARDMGESQSKAVRRDLPPLRKRYSRAARKFPEMAVNSKK